jgi:hypothetical protein
MLFQPGQRRKHRGSIQIPENQRFLCLGLPKSYNNIGARHGGRTSSFPILNNMVLQDSIPHNCSANLVRIACCFPTVIYE